MEVQPSYDKLLEAVKQLSPSALEEFQQQINQIRAGQYNIALPKKEADLLLKINQFPAPQDDSRYQELLAKRASETLAETEHKELIALSNQYEQQNAGRMESLVQLAYIRGVSLTELMDQLEIPQPMYE